MVRTNKPYQRPDAHRKGNPDAPGSWKHDMHESVKQSLASRLSNSSSSAPGSRNASKPSLLARMSGGVGKELLPTSESSKTKLHGFDGPPPANINNPNAGVELLPSGGGGRRPKNSGRGVNSQSRELVNAALGAGPQRFREPRSVSGSSSGRAVGRELLQPQQSHVSIMGAARGTTWVRVENLAVGTSAEDVVSAFAPLNILDAKLTSPTNPNTVTVDLEVEQRSDAEGLINQYHGVVADGNTLQVTIVNQGLKSRVGAGVAIAGAGQAAVNRPTSASHSAPAPQRNTASAAGQELLGGSGSGKLYSDTILASNSSSSSMILSDGTTVPFSDPSRTSAARRSDAWGAGAPNLASRIGAGGRR
ncbi:hypothetical protein IAU59_006944 [Kwoniella sp. CBS 9459]